MLALNEILYFLHIPKTAGTSLSAWLSSHFKFTEICPDLDLAALRDSPAKRRQYRYFSGHWGMKLIELIERPRIVTWLRDPARRLLSSYHYLRGLNGEMQSLLTAPFAIRQHEAARRLTFAEWVLLPQEDYAHHEVMTQSLYPQESWDEKVLSDTIHNLNQLDHVGLVERMQDSVDLLCHTFVWLPTRFTRRLNASKWSSTHLEAETLAAIRERNPWDYAVYEHGKQLFEKRWEKMLQSLGLVPSGEPQTCEAAATSTSVADARRDELHRQLTRNYRSQRSCEEHVDYIVLVQAERDRLEVELNAARSEAQLVDATVSEQSNYIKGLEAERDRLMAEVNAAQTEAARVSTEGQKHIDALAAQLAQLAATSTAQAQFICALEAERDRLQAEANAAKSAADRASKEGQMLIDALENQIELQSAEGQVRFDALRSQLDQLAATSRDQLGYITALEKERHRLNAELTDLRRQAADYLAVIKEQHDNKRALELAGTHVSGARR